MKYIIKYAGGGSRRVNGSEDLVACLKLMKRETITDIRKIYKSGVSDTVLETYEKYIGRN